MSISAIKSTKAFLKDQTTTAEKEAGQLLRLKRVDTEALNPISAYGALLPCRPISIITLNLTIGLGDRPLPRHQGPSFLIVGLTGSCFVNSYSFDKERLLFENLFRCYRKRVTKFTLKTNFI